MRFKRQFLLGLASLALGACELAPAYKTPAVVVPTHFKEAAAANQAHPSDDVPRGPWWTAFRDRTLNWLEPQVDTANQTLAIALANYEQARTGVQQAEAGLFPTLTQVSQFSDNRQSEHRTYRIASTNQPNYYGNNILGLQSSYEVDLWNNVRDQIKAAAANAQQQQALMESVRLSLHAQLAQAYLALRGIDRDLKLLTDTEKAYTDALSLTQNRLQGKIASPMDVERARAQLESARALIEDDRARRAFLEHSIATLIGQPASNFTIPPSSVEIRSPRRPISAPSTLLERRPDIAAAERAVAVANEQIGLARVAFYPQFFINLSAGTQDRGLRLFDAANAFYSIGPSITLPIFDGGVRRAQLEASIARRDQTVAQYRQTFLQAVQEVEDALAADRYLGAEDQRLQAAVTSQKKVLDLALTLYRDGATGYLDVVTAQTSLLAEQRTSLSLLTRRLSSAVSLFVAFGGGWANGEGPNG